MKVLGTVVCTITSFAVAWAQEDTAPVNQNGCVGPRTPSELRAKLLANYDKLARPSIAQAIEGGWPLTEPIQQDLARVQFHVLALSDVNQKRNEYSMTVWFRRSWNDYRLAYTPFSEGGCFPNTLGVGVGFEASMLDEIWKPDFYIQNLAKKIEGTVGAMWIEPDGTVFWSAQLEMTLACQMVFDRFPYDRQNCGIQVSTWKNDASEVRMGYLEDRPPVTLASDSDDTGSIPYGGTTEWSLVSSSGTVRTSSEGSLFEQSVVEILVELKRNNEYYVDFVLVPAFMFVVIGWLSFFVNRRAAPARVAMSMIGFLANMNFLSAQLGQLPRLGNDVWMLKFLYMSTFFSFYSIFEYVVCNYLSRIEGRLIGARKKAQELAKSPREEEEEQGTDKPTNPDSIPLTKQDLIDSGFKKRVDLLMINPRTTSMWFKDHHVEVFSRYIYPTAYLAAFLFMWYRK